MAELEQIRGGREGISGLGIGIVQNGGKEMEWSDVVIIDVCVWRLEIGE